MYKHFKIYMEHHRNDIVAEEKKEPQPSSPKNSFKKYLELAWELFKIALIALVIVVPIRYFLFQPFIVSGTSMSPTFESGNYLIVDEISYRFANPQRGDVIVFNFPKDTAERFIKRVIGLPGETVDIVNGEVEIIDSGKVTVLPERYLPAGLQTYGSTGTPAPETVTLKANQYFVMGDNRSQSYDSRFWGVVPRSDIIGKVFLRIFPVSSLSVISRPTY